MIEERRDGSGLGPSPTASPSEETNSDKLARLLDYLADEVDYEENAHLNAAIIARDLYREMRGTP